jgi:short-subunit dehydrogenase
MESKGYVLITGASSGIGRSLAITAAINGYDLILIARRANRLNEVADQCRLANPSLKVKVLVLDVASNNFLEELKLELQSISNLRFVFANAGLSSAGRTDKLNPADFSRNFSVNIGGVLNTLYASMGALKKSRGRFVITGSLNSYLALPLGAAYSMGKFAVRALAESLYCEAPVLGFETSVVCPGPIATEILSVNNKGEHVETQFKPRRGVMSSDLAAKRIFRQVKRGNREIFLSWDSRIVVWIQRHFPGIALLVTRTIFSRFREPILKMVGQVNPDAV